VVGLDVNEGMLAVAKRKAPQAEWKQGIAEDLPFDSSSFDAVVSQFGLMFFEDKAAALKEMVRVLQPGGWLALAVWDSLDHIPGYAAMVSLLQRLFGEQAVNGLRPPFSLGDRPEGDRPELQALLAEAGLSEADITTQPGVVRFPSLQAWVYTDVKGWVLDDMLDEAQFELLLKEAEQALQAFVTAQGTVSFASSAHIVTFTKP
jgi:SAM-dependent methyltransferase